MVRSTLLGAQCSQQKKTMNAQISHEERKLNTSKSDWLGAKFCVHRARSHINGLDKHWTWGSTNEHILDTTTKTNTFQEKHNGITMWRIRHNVYPHMWITYYRSAQLQHGPEKKPSQRYCLAGANIPCESQLHLVTSTIPKIHTKSQTTPSQHDSNWIIHSMAKHTTNTSPTIIQRSRHSHAIGPATSGSNPTALTIETRNLRHLQQPHRNWRTLTPAHQEKLRHKPSKNWPELLQWFRSFVYTKKCLLRTMSNAHTLRNGIGGGHGTTSRHAQRHGYRVSKSDRMFIRQSLTIHTWTIKTREETIHLTSYQIENPLTQPVNSHLTFRLKTTCCTKLCVPGTMCHTTRPFQNK